MADMHRTGTKGDGTRVIEKFTGNPIPSELVKDANWTPVVDLQPGDVFGGFVRLAADISIAEHPRADGAIIELAGVRVGVSIDQLEQAIAGFQAVVDAKKAKRAQPGAGAAAGPPVGAGAPLGG